MALTLEGVLMSETESVGNKETSSHHAIVFILGGFFVLGIAALWLGWCTRGKYQTIHSLLVNLAAGFGCLFVATAGALIVARAKLKQAALPILKLIQQLESEGRISQGAARKSVVAAVALLSESNVGRAIKPDPKAKHEIRKCPVCWLDVELNSKKRCKHCSLPDALWHSKELIEGAPPRTRAKV
jgi:hypothetical protein